MTLHTRARRPPRAMSRVTALAAFGLVASVGTAAAQTPAPVQHTAESLAAAAPAARPDDVASIDAIITALYASISGPVGAPRDFDRMRSLLIPNAPFLPTGRRPDGTFVMTPGDAGTFIERSGPGLVRTGFREVEVSRRTEQYGNIAHTFSTYDSFRGDATEPYQRGINSIQLWNDGTRWWIVSIFWEGERPDNPLPDRYLRGDG